MPSSVQGDDIPGGVWIKHAICHEDGSPKRYDTKSSIRAAEDAKGVRRYEEPIPVLNEHIERSLKSHNSQVPRLVAIPAIVSAEEEAARVRHWHETEAQLTQEKA